MQLFNSKKPVELSAHANHHGDQIVGTITAAAAVVVDKLATSGISWAELLHTSVLAAAGAAVGFLVTSALKWLKKKLTR